MHISLSLSQSGSSIYSVYKQSACAESVRSCGRVESIHRRRPVSPGEGGGGGTMKERSSEKQKL